MIKVLIVEDEIGTRNLLVESFEWEAFGCVVSGAASSGIEAIELYLKDPPDIVITDIVMPGIDGITLLRYLKQKKDSIRFIIMTGHRHFEYAKDALDLGVSSFMLKPVSHDDLEGALKLAIESLQQENHTGEKDNHSSEKILSNLLNGYVYNLSNTSDDLRRFLVQCRSYYVAAIDFDDSDTKNSTNLQSLYAFCRGIMENDIILLSRMNNERLVLLSPVFNDSRWADDVTLYFSNIQNRIKETLHFTVSIGVSGLMHDISRMHKAYLDAVKSLNYRFFLGEGSINFYSEDNENSLYMDVDIYQLLQYPPAICTAIRNTTPDQLPEAVGKLFHAIIEKLPNNPSLCRSALVCILTLCIKSIFEDNTKYMAVLLKKYQLFQTVIDCESLDSIRDVFDSIMLDLSDYNMVRKDSNKAKTLERIHQFIQDNYAEQITLNDAAKLVYLSPAYLSTLISTETGKTFIEMINEIRINKAIELLKDKTLKNYDIAQRVGFKEPQYFSFAFKKHTGLSPSEYRRLYLSD